MLFRSEIPTIDTECLLLRPDRVGEFPGVVFLTDIWGIRPSNIGMARRLAEKGFAVLMPNVFHRYSRITPAGWKPQTEAEVHKALGVLFGTLTAEQMVSDGAAYTDFLLAQVGVRPGKIGVVGYCFTGQMADRKAAAEPDLVTAAASFHGGFLVTDQPDSPHKQDPSVKAPLYFGHAVEDRGPLGAELVGLSGGGIAKAPHPSCFGGFSPERGVLDDGAFRRRNFIASARSKQWSSATS